MRAISLIIFIFFYLNINAQNIILIRVNTNDCSNCLGVGGMVNSLRHNKIFVFKDGEDAIGARIVNEVFRLQDSNYTMIFNTERYNNLSDNSESSVHLERENEILLSAKLCNIGQHINDFNLFTSYRKIESKVIFKEDPGIGKPLRLVNSKDSFILFDKRFGTMYTISDLDADDVSVQERKLSFEVEVVCKKLGVDVEFREKYKSYLESINQWHIKTININKAEDGIYSLHSLPSLNRNKKNEIYVEQEFFVNTPDKEILKFKEYPKGKYDIDQSNLFFIYNSNFYFSVFKDKIKRKNNRAFIRYTRINNELIFTGYFSELPKELVDNQVGYNYNSYGTDGKYLFYHNVNVVYDIEKDSQFNLPITYSNKYINSNKVEIELYILSIVGGDSIIKIIYCLGDNIYCMFYDKVQKTIIDNSLIKLIPPDSLKSNISLGRSQDIFYINTNNELITVSGD